MYKSFAAEPSQKSWTVFEKGTLWLSSVYLSNKAESCLQGPGENTRFEIATGGLLEQVCAKNDFANKMIAWQSSSDKPPDGMRKFGTQVEWPQLLRNIGGRSKNHIKQSGESITKME